MFNPIEARKRLVQERIEKSFQDNVGEQRERESTSDVVEKAYQVGDEKQFNGRNYYVHALNSKGQPMWRLKRDGAKKDEEGGGEKNTAKPEEKKSVSDHASEASDEALKRAAADEKAKPEVRDAAKKELEKRNGVENNSNLSAKDSKEIKRIDKKLKNLDYQMKQTIKERDADESYTPSDDPDDFDYYKNTIAAQEKEIARLKKRRENILKNSGDKDKVANEKPSEEKQESDEEQHDIDLGDKVAKQITDDAKDGDSDSDFTDEDDKRFNELDGELTTDLLSTNRDEYYKKLDEFRKLKQKKYNQRLKDSGALNLNDFKGVAGISDIWLGEAVDSNGKMITPYIRINLERKSDVNKFIKDVKKKFGIELSSDDFEYSPRNRYSDSFYEVCVNPETGKFADDWKTNAAIKESAQKKQAEINERKRNEKKKQATAAIKESITKDSVENFLDDDDVRSHAFSYFNYGDDDECSDEEKEQFKKLKKLGAKMSSYFDWTEDEKAEKYERKMQSKGYRLFDISTGDGYMWLLIKNNKLDKGGEIKKSLESVSDLIEEIRNNR